MPEALRYCPICSQRWREATCPRDGVETIDERLLSGDLVLPSPAPGSILAGRYRLGASLGEGAHGAVHSAQQLSIQREVALKLLHRHQLDPEGFRRFYREAHAASRLVSPHIVKVFDFGVDGETGTPFIAMERVAGRSLASLIQAEAPLAEARTLALVRQIALALEAAHRAGIVHRDLKPQNVMVSASAQGEHATVLDFGIAKLAGLDSLTSSREVVGTPVYMSPEQALGAPTTGQADLYALGCILHELLTGKPPYAGDTPVQVMYAHVREPVPPLSGFDPGWQALHGRLLAKSPAHRPQGASGLLALLARVERGEAIDPPDAEQLEEARPTATIETAPGVGETIGFADTLRRVDGEAPGSRAPARARGRVRSLGPFALVIGGGLLGVGLLVTGLNSSWPWSPSPPLMAEGAVVACPPLDGPGWLGAAVASRLCGRLVTMMGGGPDRQLTAPELYELPRAPTESAPEDPYSSAEARAGAVERAKREADAWVDGQVQPGEQGLEARIVLRAPDGKALASAEGKGELHVLERVLARALVEQGQIPAVSRFPHDHATWLGIQTSTTALLHFDVGLGLWESRYSKPDCDALLEAEDVAPFRRRIIRTLCLGEPLEVDRSSVPALVGTVPHASLSPRAALDWARELRALRLEATDSVARVRLASAEASAWLQGGQPGRSREAAVAAVLADPEDLGARLALAFTAYGRGPNAVVWANINAWRPDFGNWWGAWALEHPTGSERALRYLRRAHVLSPFNASTAADLTVLLLRRGEVEEASKVAVRLGAGPSRTRVAAEVLMMLVEVRQGRLAEAERRAGVLLETIGRFGVLEQQDIYLVGFIADLATLTPRAQKLAVRFAERFVLGDPIRLVPGSPYGLEGAAIGCLAASELRAPCLERLGTLLADGYFSAVTPVGAQIFEGLNALAQGDARRATEHLRSLAGSGNTALLGLYAPVLTAAFEAAGADDLAERVDRRLMQQGGLYAGVGPEHVRAARRARDRGEEGRAARLARAVIDALDTSDAALPVVEALRPLAGR